MKKQKNDQEMIVNNTSFEQTISSIHKHSQSDNTYTNLLEATGELKEVYRGVTPYIAMTTNYHFPTEYGNEQINKKNYYYSRSDNPNYTELEKQIAIYHDASSAVAFASGMAAISAVIQTGYRKKIILYASEIYNDVPRLLRWMKEEQEVNTCSVSITETDKVIEKIKSIGVGNIGLVYCESQSNPHSQIPDFIPLFSFIKEFDPSILIAVDNTFLSPVLFRPFKLPPLIIKSADQSKDSNNLIDRKIPLVDIVIESATKYLSGKSDALLGLVCLRKHEKGDLIIPSMKHRITSWRSISGGSPSPFNCWLVSKGLETLPLRVKAQAKATVKVVSYLEQMPFVTRVIHPSLQSHPNHDRTKYFYKGLSGALFRFHIPSSILPDDLTLMSNIQPFIWAVSFGSSHTLFCSMQDICGPVFPGESEDGVFGTWIRVAIGLQSSSELIRSFTMIFLRNEILHLPFATITKFSKSKSNLSYTPIKNADHTMESMEKDIYFVLHPSSKYVVFIRFLEKMNSKGSPVSTQIFFMDDEFESANQDKLIRDALQKHAELRCFKNLTYKAPRK